MATLGSLRHASVAEQTFVLSLGAIPVESLLQLRSWMRYRVRGSSHRGVSAKLAASEDEAHTMLRNAFASFTEGGALTMDMQLLTAAEGRRWTTW